MNDLSVTGIVLKAEPIGEYDKRVVLLTKERGKISVFARGALRPKNRFVACTNPFVFGTFELYAGSNSYSLTKADVQNYFDRFMTDLDVTFYGTYFLEIADYYGRENTDNVALLRLLYKALTLLCDEEYSRDFVKTVFELKAIMLEGEFPFDHAEDLPEGGKSALKYIYESRPENVFSFRVGEESFRKLKERAKVVRSNTFDKHFNSLDIIEGMENT